MSFLVCSVLYGVYVHKRQLLIEHICVLRIGNIFLSDYPYVFVVAVTYSYDFLEVLAKYRTLEEKLKLYFSSKLEELGIASDLQTLVMISKNLP